jgi:hypothetical protein
MHTAASALSCVPACVQSTAPSLRAARHTVPSLWPSLINSRGPTLAAQLSVCLFVSLHNARYTFSAKSSLRCSITGHDRTPSRQPCILSTNVRTANDIACEQTSGWHSGGETIVNGAVVRRRGLSDVPSIAASTATDHRPTVFGRSTNLCCISTSGGSDTRATSSVSGRMCDARTVDFKHSLGDTRLIHCCV